MSALVIPGRVFLTRIFQFTRGMPAVGRHTITDDVKKDVRWWRAFLNSFNGVSMMAVDEWSAPDTVFSTDACLSGLGGWYPGRGAYFHKELPDRFMVQKRHISELELLTIVVALKVWGKHWAGQKIVVNCDNEASVVVLNSGRCKNPFMQDCLREIAFCTILCGKVPVPN